MANFQVSMGIRDADGGLASVGFSLVAASIAAAIIRAEFLMPLVDALIQGRIDSCKVSQDLSTTAFTKTVPVAGQADNEVKGRFIFDSTGGFLTRVSLPSFDKNAHTVVGGAINTADAGAVEDFVDEMTIQGWADYRYADIVSLKSAYEAFGR